MPTSKTDASRKNKAQNFKDKAKKEAAQAQVPHTHMIPQTEWQSDDNLILMGSIAEGIEINLVKAYEALQHAGQLFQQMIQLNIQAGKVKMTYIWNNGDIPTKEEQEMWVKQMQFLNDERAKKMAEIQAGIQKGAVDSKNAEEGGLQTVGGQPLTEENLENEKSGIVIVQK